MTISVDPWRYRDYVRGSRGEFTVAKDMNVRLRSGWFSDRAACAIWLPADRWWSRIRVLAPGLHAFLTVEDAAAAVHLIEADYERASTHATEVAQEYFAAEKVLVGLLRQVGF